MSYPCSLPVRVLLLIVGFLLLFASHTAFAANFTVSPLLIDEEVEARDILNESITLINQTDRPIRAYASVHEVTLGEGTEIREFVPASMTVDRATAITSWLEISRARLEIPAQGTLEVPLTIKVHPEAPPGEYHALIGFASGRNVDEIEKQVMSGNGESVLLKLTIADTRQAGLRLVNFLTKRFVVSPDDGTLSFTVENTGDVPLTPTGEVIIYDTAGRELTSVEANSRNVTIAPGERVAFTEALPFLDRLGRNKAYLSLEYGPNQAAVFDTTFYYSVPWYYLAVFGGLLIIVMLLLAYIFKRAFLGTVGDEPDGIYEVPLFYRKAHDHEMFDHDLNLKHDDKTS